MERDSKIYLIVGLVIAVVVIGFVVYAAKSKSGPGQLDGFATCLKDQGAAFYGAFWCPHCQATKALFGNSAKLLPYVECSTPDGSGQTQVCIDKKIQSYPTWIFKDGSQLQGEVTLEALSQKTNCQIHSGPAVIIANTGATSITIGTTTSSSPAVNSSPAVQSSTTSKIK